MGVPVGNSGLDCVRGPLSQHFGKVEARPKNLLFAAKIPESNLKAKNAEGMNVAGAPKNPTFWEMWGRCIVSRNCNQNLPRVSLAEIWTVFGGPGLY